MGKPIYPSTYKEPPEATSSAIYRKSGISIRHSKRGYTFREQLYETKLLSLLYFRAIRDDNIQEFQLATNIDKIGAFDDICFKAEVKGHNKPVTVFIQAKHRENKKKALKIDLATYFDSYMKIRGNFGRDPRYPFVHRENKKKALKTDLAEYFDSYLKIRENFGRNERYQFVHIFNETECLFVIFTNSNVDYSDAPATSGLSAKLNDILDMGGMVKQPNSEENIEYLTKKTVKDQISSLAEWITGFIYDDKNFQLMQSEELFLRYHVILAQKVFEVSDIQPLEKDATPYRIASFRQDFFDNNEEYIILFRDKLYLEVIKQRRIGPTESDIPVFLTELLADPTDATRLSKLIGTVVTYNRGQLEFNKQSTKTFRPNIKPIDVSQSTVNKAVELAAIEILSSVKFKVPAAFGNKDLTLTSGNDVRIERRICYLALKIIDLLDNCKFSKMVTIDESLEYGLLRLNGGIAGAIGNMFVLDDNTKLMKITDNCETLGTFAKSLYTKLKSEVHNLHEYKFCFTVDNFPKLSFDCSHYEEKMARDFLNKVLVYCNQPEENELQEILKNEIEDLQRNQPNYFQAKTDAILLRYYDEIQKWCTAPQHVSYLSQRIDFIRQLIDDIIKDPLMSSINLTYESKIKQHDYTFTEDAVRSLNLQDQRSSTIIIAENCVLTVVKVLQHLKNKDHVVLDVEYIASLPTNDLNALRTELMNTRKENVLIIVCDKIDSKNEMHTLKNIAEAVKNKTNIIITDPKSLEILMIQKYFPEVDKILHDKKFSLIDVCKESQKSIFESATVLFPGVEIRLHHLVRGWHKTGLMSTGKADATDVAAVSDKPTATGSRDFGTEGVEERLEPLYDQYTSKSFLAPDEGLKFNKDYYDVSGEKFLFILSHTIFLKNQPSMKNGNEHDIKALTNVFRNLGFEIVVTKDWEYEKIINYLTGFANKDHSKTSCICITILTRVNKSGEIHASDRSYRLTDVIGIFEEKRSLVDKPKLFFVQACRDVDLDAGNTVDFAAPTHDDFLVLCSSGKELFSHRSKKSGSWMIQALCHVIQNHHKLLDLLEMINLMNRFVVYETPTSYSPFYTWSTLTKRLKL